MPSSHLDTIKTVVVVGATSGIGQALAKRFHDAGKQVIITGRRQERLDELAKQHKGMKGVKWDITDLKGIPSKVEEIFKGDGGKDVNAVILVSGLQRTTDFTKPKELDFEQINLEILTNYTAYIHLLSAFLPYLSEKESILAAVSSSLALLPMPRTPVYNGTKAALHQLLLSVRSQLQSASSPVKLVEIYPPAVQTELHDKKNQPDLPDDYPALPLEDFVREAWEGFEGGWLDIPVGDAKKQWEAIDKPRQDMLAEATKKK